MCCSWGKKLLTDGGGPMHVVQWGVRVTCDKPRSLARTKHDELARKEKKKKKQVKQFKKKITMNGLGSFFNLIFSIFQFYDCSSSSQPVVTPS